MRFRWSLVLAVALMLVGCGTVRDFWQDPHTKHFIHGARGKDLLMVRIDQFAKEAEEFGTAGIAAPVLALPDKRFAFGLDHSAETYYDHAREDVQLGVARTSELLNSFRSGTQVQADIGQLLAAQAGLAQFNAALDALDAVDDAVDPDSIEVPEFPEDATAAGTPPSVPEDLLPDLERLREVMLNGGDFAGAGELLPDDFDPVVSDRDAILIAHQSKVVQGLLDFMGDPALKEELDGKVYLFGVTTVSVAPGHRTESGYAASIDCVAKYKWRPADHETAVAVARNLVADETLNKNFRDSLASTFLNSEIDLPAKPDIPASLLCESCETSPGIDAPFVLPVTPLIDSQVLDLAMSRRRYQEFAQHLALTAVFAGSQAATKGALEFIEVLQEDARGKSLNVAVSAFSYSGGNFGFEIGPRLAALELEGSRAKRGESLERQSFPALLLIAMNKHDISPRFDIDPKTQQMRMLTPVVNLRSAGSWKPLSKRGKRQKDSRRFRRSEEISSLLDDLDKANVKRSEFLSLREEILAYKRASFANLDIPSNLFTPAVVGRPDDLKLLPAKVEKLKGTVSFAVVGKNVNALNFESAFALAKKADGSVKKLSPTSHSSGAIGELIFNFGADEYASAEIVVAPTELAQVYTGPVTLTTAAVVKEKKKAEAAVSHVALPNLLEPSLTSLVFHRPSEKSNVSSEYALQLSGFFADPALANDGRPKRPASGDKRTVEIESVEVIAGQAEFESDDLEKAVKTGLLNGNLTLHGAGSFVELMATLVEYPKGKPDAGAQPSADAVEKRYSIFSRRIEVTEHRDVTVVPTLGVNVETQE